MWRKISDVIRKRVNVGRAIADLAGAENIEVSHFAEAIQYRSLDRRMQAQLGIVGFLVDMLRH